MTPCVGLLALCFRMHAASVSISRLPVSAGRPVFFTSPWSGDAIGGSTSETRAFLHRLAGLVAVVEVVLAQGAGRTLRRGPGPSAPDLAAVLVFGALIIAVLRVGF